MQTSPIDNIFGFRTAKKGNYTQLRRNSFESVIPSQPKEREYTDSGYYRDSISELVSNQSLTPEQIAKSQTKAIIEEIDVLPSKYKISNFEEVKHFLSKNRFLIPLLEEISNKILQYYGSQQKTALEVFYEPDFPQSCELWVLVLTELSAGEARSIMNKFDKDWWLKNLYKADCKLNVGIEYV